MSRPIKTIEPFEWADRPGVPATRTMRHRRRSYRLRLVSIVDRWAILCGSIGLLTTLLATDWEIEIVAIVTAGSVAVGSWIGILLAFRLSNHHDAWMKHVDRGHMSH